MFCILMKPLFLKLMFYYQPFLALLKDGDKFVAVWDFFLGLAIKISKSTNVYIVKIYPFLIVKFRNAK